MTIDFGEVLAASPNDFTLGDITVSGGTATALVHNGNGNYSATIDPTMDGVVLVDISAGVAQDPAGNDNVAASQFAVTVAPIKVSVVGSDLVVQDLRDSNQNLTVQYDPAGSGTVVIDAGSQVIGIDPSANGGTTSGDGTTVANVDASQFSGNVIINTLGGDDSVIVDFSLGDFSSAIDINGGETNESAGDMLTLQGGGTFASAEYSYGTGGAANSGTVNVSGNSLITYTGLEPLISTISTTETQITLPASAGNVQMSDIGGSSLRIESLESPVAFERTDFQVPSSKISIFGGAGDIVTISTALDIGADLTITAEDVSFTSTVDGAMDLDVNASGTTTLAAMSWVAQRH